MVLCATIVSMSVMPAYASSTRINGENALAFSSVDDIALDQVCVLVFGDMNQSGADSEGRAIIGGNLTIDSGWSASVKAKFNNDYALVVGGNIKISGGNLDVGGCLAQNAGSSISGGYNCTNCSNGGNYVHKVSSGWINSYIQNAAIQFKTVSSSYASKAANGTVSSTNWGDFVPGSGHKAGTPHVFYINGEGQRIAFNMIQNPSSFGDDGIIINVSGKTVTFDGSNFQGGNEDFKRNFNGRTTTSRSPVRSSMPFATNSIRGSIGSSSARTVRRSPSSRNPTVLPKANSPNSSAGT